MEIGTTANGPNHERPGLEVAQVIYEHALPRSRRTNTAIRLSRQRRSRYKIDNSTSR
jgi:hypothetical protein